MKKLELAVHPKLENLLGYTGNAPKVLFYWDGFADTLMYDDGELQGSANAWAYLLWLAHASVKPHLTLQTLLLLDRSERQLYSLEAGQIAQVLQTPGGPLPLSLYTPPADPWQEAQQLLADFVTWLGQTAQPKAA